jgi:hypothetical protein
MALHRPPFVVEDVTFWRVVGDARLVRDGEPTLCRQFCCIVQNFKIAEAELAPTCPQSTKRDGRPLWPEYRPLHQSSPSWSACQHEPRRLS